MTPVRVSSDATRRPAASFVLSRFASESFPFRSTAFGRLNHRSQPDDDESLDRPSVKGEGELYKAGQSAETSVILYRSFFGSLRNVSTDRLTIPVILLFLNTKELKTEMWRNQD